MGIFTCYGSKNPKGRSYSITASFNSQFYDIFRIEIDRIGGKRCSGSMFDVLIDRKYRHITGICQATMSQQRLQTVQYSDAPVRINPDFIYCIGRRNMNQ